MKASILAVASLLIAGPAIADPVANITLIIENDAGMVTQMTDLTQRECDGIAALLSPRKMPGTYLSFSSTPGIICLDAGGGVSACSTTGHWSKVATSKLTTAHCVAPAAPAAPADPATK